MLFRSVVKNLLGDQNIASLDLKELGDRFKTAELDVYKRQSQRYSQPDSDVGGVSRWPVKRTLKTA